MALIAHHPLLSTSVVQHQPSEAYMLYSNGDANFSARQAQPLNSFSSLLAPQGAGAIGWQQQPELQHALQQFIAQQLALQLSQRQQTGVQPWQFAPQNPFNPQNQFNPQNTQSHGVGSAPHAHVLHQIAQSLHLLAQQLAHLAAQGAQGSQQPGMIPSLLNQPLANSYFPAAGGQPFGTAQQFGGAGQQLGMGQAVH